MVGELLLKGNLLELHLRQSFTILHPQSYVRLLQGLAVEGAH